MRPRADEIMRSVIDSFATYIVPEVEEPYAKSMASTLLNLMRHVELRIRQEGPMLFADNAELRSLLIDVRAFCVGRQEDDLLSVSDEIDIALGKAWYGPEDYPTLELVTEEATALRWALQRAIRALDRRRADVDSHPGYDELRARIRRYLGASLEREMPLIMPAFDGDRR